MNLPSDKDVMHILGLLVDRFNVIREMIVLWPCFPLKTTEIPVFESSSGSHDKTTVFRRHDLGRLVLSQFGWMTQDFAQLTSSARDRSELHISTTDNSFRCSARSPDSIRPCAFKGVSAWPWMIPRRLLQTGYQVNLVRGR